MPATTSLYDHTAKLFANGANSTTDTYKLMLCASATFASSDTTLAGITKTEISGNGYTAGGASLSGVVVTQSGNDAFFDANDVTFTASGGTLGTATKAILYNSTDTGSPPVAFIDFGESLSTADGTSLIVQWAAGGIVTFTVA